MGFGELEVLVWELLVVVAVDIDCETLEGPTIVVGGDEVGSGGLEVLVRELLDVEVTVVEIVELDEMVVDPNNTQKISQLVVETVWVVSADWGSR